MSSINSLSFPSVDDVTMRPGLAGCSRLDLDKFEKPENMKFVDYIQSRLDASSMS